MRGAGRSGRAVAVIDPEDRHEVAHLLPRWGRIRDVRTEEAGCVYLLADAAGVRLLHHLAPRGAACALDGQGRVPGR